MLVGLTAQSDMYSCLSVLLHLHGWEQQEKKYGLSTLLIPQIFTFSGNRPLSFILLLHSDNQSESTTKFYNSSKADVRGNVLTLTLRVLRSDQTESVWMTTDLLKFPVHSIHLLRKMLQCLAGCCRYFLNRGKLRGGGGYPH